ncbi:MAG: nicotinate (nicotinamide) nucleotide adenylyltransferase [Chlorobiaceae bacterium]|nr:nicotinate (nicotinamide) nucleotide adenylyltransferase [Chlorobiales bacterium]NTU90391.1 nicotinate (nicotinamide) nucleotide adenylyltransferase [Chlorobiaceae bacterium]NTV26133.1 nicotinate (nicotinamide) nucleotide adenylyltransferase [Chlorobiaceae bacterium]
MRLGVFGGSFDPPHNGHLALCRTARERLGLSHLIISVSNNPFKTGTDAPDAHRLRMAELLAREIDPSGAFAEVSDWELQRPGPSYTIDLLLYLHECYPTAELMLLVGEDSYRDMPRWRSLGEIRKLSRIIVFERKAAHDGGLTREPLPPAEIIELDVPVSATEVRRRLECGESAAHLVPPSIAEYIAHHGLYRTT